jgi:hypothetical protein
MIVCAALAIGLVLTGCDNGTNGGGTGTENTGGNNTGGNNTDNGDNTGGNDGGNTGGTTSTPGVPTGVKATALSSTSIRITWNAVSGATRCKIYSSRDSSSGFVFLAGTTMNSYTDTFPKADETWYYKVSAVNSAGESAQSSWE